VLLKPVYVGPQGALSGLDQINLILPLDTRTGLLELVVIGDGLTSNAVEIQIGSQEMTR
jgi:uncharacterized protein (TIGR03437 family)